MPENYYCLDNFFQKMTDLESPRKNNDCYFYYYSTCTKGDNCTFRHEPSALGCETTCSFWKEGKCINVRCNFRHMELRKNRKTIPCYWEAQPSGCKKPHCPFMHVSKKSESDENENLSDDQDDICKLKSKKEEFAAPVVDPIVVNFEEESDNESSAPTQSSHRRKAQRPVDREAKAPSAVRTTRGAKAVEVKTLEEIKLDKIQAESAAYYSYSDELTPRAEDPEGGNTRKGVFQRLQPLGAAQGQEKQKEVDIKDVQVLTLDEIRRRKRKNRSANEQPSALPEESTEGARTERVVQIKRPKIQLEQPEHEGKTEQQTVPATSKRVALRKTTPTSTNVPEIKIKTLAEIKAEKQMKIKRKLGDEQDTEQNVAKLEVDNGEVKQLPTKRVKICLNRGAESDQQDEQEVSSTSKTDEARSTNVPAESPSEPSTKVQCVVAPVKRQEVESVEQSVKVVSSEKSEVTNVTTEPSIQSTNEVQVEKPKPEKEIVLCKDEDSKLDDLLLEDEDDDIEGGSLTLKAEDDILNDIDDLLNE